MPRKVVLFLFLFLALDMFALELYVTNVNSHLNIRKEPSVNSEIVGTVARDHLVEFLGDVDEGWYKRKNETWYKIRFHDVTGWVNGNYLRYKFPARLVITTKNVEIHRSSMITNDAFTPANTDIGDTLLTTGEGRTPMGFIDAFTLDGGSLIAKDDCRYIGIVDDSELSRYSYTPFTVRLKLILIIFLIITSFVLFINNKNLWGIFLVALTLAAEMWYLNTTSHNTWFVNPKIVGYVWTYINGIFFLVVLLCQYIAIQGAVACFGTGGIVSDWGFKIGLVWCLMTGEMGIAVLAIPIIFLYGLIGHFRWSQVLYGILGCVVWFYSLRYFGTIIYTFHDFFVWTIVLMIFGSIPASGKAYNRQSFGDNRFHLEYTADGTPYYYDSNRIMHILYDGGEGKTFSDSHGKRFNSDGWYIWRAD